MNAYPVMTSMSDVVALKRVDMETIGRQKRKCLVPITPRVVAWNVNNERTSTYFPNINRSFIADMTYVPGKFSKKREHRNSTNRNASWLPYSPSTQQVQVVEEEDDQENDDAEEMEISMANPLQHPALTITKPLRLLSREYKHPLSMYEETLSTIYSRFAQRGYARLSYPALNKDPILPRQYYSQLPPLIGGPVCAGKQWVTNRWRMWSGGSSTSPA